MKKIISILLAVILIVSVFAGCRVRFNSSTNDTTEKTTVPTETTTENKEEPGTVSPLLWMVTDDSGHKLYLFGTIHVGDGRNEEVVGLLKPVLDECGAFAFEFDMKAYTEDAAAMAADVMGFMYTDGTKIYDHMPREDYENAKAFLQKNREYFNVYDAYNTAFWSQIIDNVITDKYTGLKSDYGMDTLLLDYAYENGKKVLEVESASFQYGLLNSFSDELYLLMLREELADPEQCGREIEELYEVWLGGDYDTFCEMFEDDGDTEGMTEEQIALVEDYNDKLVTQRNLGMFEKAKNYIAGGETVFFAVGGGHMVLDGGIVQLFKNEGYTVQRVPLGADSDGENYEIVNTSEKEIENTEGFEWLKFSKNEASDGMTEVAEWMANDIEKLKEAAGESYREPDFYIAPYDMDGDGDRDFVVYICHIGYTGSAGSSLSVMYSEVGEIIDEKYVAHFRLDTDALTEAYGKQIGVMLIGGELQLFVSGYGSVKIPK